ncbi:MAG: nitronate monooxygenase [Bacteroidetes bacterium]|nr:nitronate monooxygenase [Bacteroidota bacterium]
MENRITSLFDIRYPIVQAGMIWCSGWRLASAASNAGILGLLGAGSMYPDVLREHIHKMKTATSKPFGVNIPLLYPDIEELMNLILEEGVKIVFTSAGNPATWTQHLKDNGVTVVHVIANKKFARKAVDAGVDAIVAEGFEAGGHNGKEETTTLVLIPGMVDEVTVPVIAAGGISDGRSMAAAMALGADGVQVGSRFALSEESSAHIHFKQAIANATEGSTRLMMKDIVPVRLLDNPFARKMMEAELACEPVDHRKQLLGRGRAKLGMFEGNMEDGELEIGQVSGNMNRILPVATIVEEMVTQYNNCIDSLIAQKL